MDWDSFFKDAEKPALMIFIYFLFGRFGDGRLEQSEVQASVQSVRRWFSGMEDREFNRNLIHATTGFKAVLEEEDEEFAEKVHERALETLKAMDADRASLERLVAGLFAVARADDEVTDAERSWLASVASALDVDLEQFRRKRED